LRRNIQLYRPKLKIDRGRATGWRRCRLGATSKHPTNETGLLSVTDQNADASVPLFYIALNDVSVSIPNGHDFRAVRAADADRFRIIGGALPFNAITSLPEALRVIVQNL